MWRRVVDFVGDVGVGHLFGRVEHPQAEAGGEEALNGAIDRLLRDQSLGYRHHQGRVSAATVEVTAGLHSQGGRFGRCPHDLVVPVDVADGPAIGDDVTIEAPLPPQDFLQQSRAGAGRLAIDAVIGPHDRDRLSLPYASLKGGQIRIVQVPLADPGVEVVAVVFRPAVDGVMFGRGHQLEVVRIVPLEPFDKGHPHAGGQIGVLAVSLLATPPAGIAEDVDIRRPEGEAGINLPDALPHRFVVFGPGFVGNSHGDLAHQVRIPGRRQADGLGEDGGQAGPADAMQTFVPPIVLGDPQALDGRRVVHHLGYLLFQGHLGDQVLHPFWDRSGGGLVGREGSLTPNPSPSGRGESGSLSLGERVRVRGIFILSGVSQTHDTSLIYPHISGHEKFMGGGIIITFNPGWDNAGAV